MYNSPAMASDKASTSLHVDNSDAVNMLSDAVMDPATAKRSADWVIFPSDEHSYRILHTYLEEKFKDDPRTREGDIIHSQRVVITKPMLKELKEVYGLRPWEIEQKLGDSIFIPSRCPHMVRCNIVIQSFDLHFHRCGITPGASKRPWTSWLEMRCLEPLRFRKN